VQVYLASGWMEAVKSKSQLTATYGLNRELVRASKGSRLVVSFRPQTGPPPPRTFTSDLAIPKMPKARALQAARTKALGGKGQGAVRDGL
jgi:hypothetical protein